MDLTPIQLRLDQGKLIIVWSDDSEQSIPIRKLRDRCPCAACREEKAPESNDSRPALPILDSTNTKPLDILGMDPVGHYAYTIRFSDGHDNGIFSFEYLKSFDQNPVDHD